MKKELKKIALQDPVSGRRKLKRARKVKKTESGGERNDYSKSDLDATFMRMKEVRLGNGRRRSVRFGERAKRKTTEMPVEKRRPGMS
jgi:hypothetical protein